MEALTSMDDDLHGLSIVFSPEPDQSWDNLSIDFEGETFTGANTPTGPQCYLELECPLPESDSDYYTSGHQIRPHPTTYPSFQQSQFQSRDEIRGPTKLSVGTKSSTQKRFPCDRPGCSSSFKRPADKQRHVITRHDRDCVYKCVITGCEKTFFRRDKLLAHMHRPHTTVLHSPERNLSPTTTQTLPSFENLVKDLDAEVGYSFVDQWDRSTLAQIDGISCQYLQNNPGSCTPTTESGCGLIDESCGGSDLNSSGGSISTGSRSPCKAVASANHEAVTFGSGTLDQYHVNLDEHPRRRFPCPYRRHDPRTYDIRRYHSCVFSSWDTLSRLKEHLYRCHMAAYYCTRCWAQFKSQRGLATHRDATKICQNRPRPSIKEITPEIEARLRSRKCSLPWQTDEQKWKDIYSMLFPGEVAPDPYYSEPTDFDNEAPSRTADSAAEKPHSQSSLGRVLESLQEDLLRDFRSRLQITPVEGGGPLDAASQSHALSVFGECQARVFGSYRASVAAATAGGGGGDDVHAKAQADFSNIVNIEMTF